MATVINNPTPATTTTEGTNSGMGFLLGIILLIVIIALFVIYGLPYLGRAASGPTVNVPGKVDVNVHTPASGGYK